MKIFKDLNTSKWQNHGFQHRKAVKQWRGPESTAKERKEAIPAKWAADLAGLGHWWLAFTCEHVNANAYQELMRQDVFS
jgi:hypothetical protein